jgi:glycerophosphoryl diester phosphodiesterase
MQVPRAATAALAATAFAALPALAEAHQPRQHDAHGAGTDLPLVTGHRGASGYLPEHTLASYKRAIELGADYIEPDLVATKDGVLVARHEPWIGGTTDVATKFPDRKRVRNVDGADVEDWFVADFTLKELKTLRAKQPMAQRPQQFNGLYEIPTFDEVLALAKRGGRERGRPVGVYPETKHPTYHQQLGLPLERRVVDALRRAGLNHKGAPVIIQSFEQANLRYLNRITPVTLAQLVDAWDVNVDGSLQYAETSLRPYDWTVSGNPELMSRTYGFLTTNAGLDEVSRYADIVAPWKPYIVPTTGTDANHDGAADDITGDGQVDERDRATARPTSLIRRAHRHGLKVHTWTFRNDPQYVAGDYAGGPQEEYALFYALGIDGLFSDFPDTALAARDAFFGED